MAVHILSCGMLLPEFVQYSPYHPCAIPTKLFFSIRLVSVYMVHFIC